QRASAPQPRARSATPALPRATRCAGRAPAVARPRHAPRQSRYPYVACPWRRTSRSRRTKRNGSLALTRTRLRLGGGPVARPLDHLPHPFLILAFVADQDARPAFIMRRLPEAVRIGRFQDFDRVEIDRNAER